MASNAQYNAGTAAALAYIRHEIDVLPIPPFARDMIPIDQEPVVARDVAKVVIDAYEKAPK